jgi:hypothetical protein
VTGNFQIFRIAVFTRHFVLAFSLFYKEKTPRITGVMRGAG